MRNVDDQSGYESEQCPKFRPSRLGDQPSGATNLEITQGLIDETLELLLCVGKS